jgi:hypothetical protein
MSHIQLKYHILILGVCLCCGVVMKHVGNIVNTSYLINIVHLLMLHHCSLKNLLVVLMDIIQINSKILVSTYWLHISILLTSGWESKNGLISIFEFGAFNS